jgi:hypothetical protein
MYIDQGPGLPPALDPVNNPASWNRVDAWVKLRLNSLNINRFGHIFFVINDSGGGPNVIGLGAPPRDWLTLPGLLLGQWSIFHAWQVGNWERWESRNLRAVLSVMGTQNPINVGVTTVDMEWFAFRLSEEIPPH